MPSLQPTTRPTQKDVAMRAGVSQGTVSLALRKHPSIPKKTAEIVRDVAMRLGYTPDPYLAGLASYRKRMQTPELQASLAWLSNDRNGESWKSSPVSSSYHAGASARALQLGYQLEDHCLLQAGMTPSRMENILYARNIQGIIVAPQPRAGTVLDFNFGRFSAVTLGHTLSAPQLNLVTWNQFKAMSLAFRKLVNLGYKRIALAVDAESDRCSGHNWSSSFWSEQQRMRIGACLPALIKDNINFSIFKDWYWCHKPDAVISTSPDMQKWLEKMGVGVPTDTGFLLLSVSEDDALTSGLSEQSAMIGAKAVDLLLEMIHRFEQGVPAQQWSVLANATWREGRTVRDKNHETKILEQGCLKNQSALKSYTGP
jgi:DNA-binding LacI/PurR family transcriptional regulator